MLTKIEFEELKNFNNEPCISIYAPMELTGDYDKNRICVRVEGCITLTMPRINCCAGL